MRKQPLIGLVSKPQYQAVAGKQQRPEKQRSLLPRPEHCKLIGQRQITIAVMKDISDREIVVECSRDKEDCSDKHCAEARNPSATRSFAQLLGSRLLSDQSDQSCEKAIGAQRECQE